MIKRQRREGTEMGDVERGGRDCWFGVGDEKEGASPLYLGQSHHSDLFLAPARFEGLPVGKWEGKKK